MRSRKSMFGNLSACAIQVRQLELERLSVEDGYLLRALIKAIPCEQIYYPKGSVFEVIHKTTTYHLSCNHHLLVVSREHNRVHAVELIDGKGDFFHYRYLGCLQGGEDGVKFIPSVLKPEKFFIDVDYPQPRSARFEAVVARLLMTHPKISTIYKSGSIYQFSEGGRDIELHMKMQGVIHVRPSKYAGDASGLRVEFVFREHLGKGAYGSVAKAPTYRLIGTSLAQGEHPRVTKVIHQWDRGGNQESRLAFKNRVVREYTFARLFSLKPKPPLFDWSSQRAYLTVREVPGVTLYDWLRRRLSGLNPPFIEADEAYQVSIAYLNALADLHDRGLIHGDLKNDNVMIDFQADGSVRAQIIDAGAASYVTEPTPYRAHSSYTCPESSSDLCGKSGYVPCNSQAADVYALGIDLVKLFGFEYDNVGDGHLQYRLIGKPNHVYGLSDHEVRGIKDLLVGLLHVSPRHRYKADRAAKQLSGYYKSHLGNSSLNKSSSPERPGLK